MRPERARSTRRQDLAAPVLAAALFLAAGLAAPARAELEVRELVLDNGITFLLVPRPGQPMVAAGWVVHAGSAAERVGTTGVAHLIEHLMFQGTEVIGTRDYAQEKELMARREQLEARRREASGDRAVASLDRDIERVKSDLQRLRVRGEYAFEYTQAGAVGINAITNRDFSVYYLLIPRSRLELWFWMESDRLQHPVLRGLYDEFEVVEQERGQRVGSTPAGPARERFDLAFWGSGHPYSWLPVGLAEDLRGLRASDARSFLGRNYRGSRLTAALVGDFDPEVVAAWARRYFGRLPSLEEQAPPVDLPAPRLGSLEDVCVCRPQVEIRYLTVPFGHPDQAALDVLAGLLNGRTGRLNQSLVVDRKIAFSASAQSSQLARAGWFSLIAEGRDEASVSRDDAAVSREDAAAGRADADPARLGAGLEAELDRLRSGPIPDRELEKVRNQITTDAARQIKEPGALMLRLLLYDALGDWRYLQRWDEAARAVDADDVRAVLQRYFVPERRATLLLRRQATGEAAH